LFNLPRTFHLTSNPSATLAVDQPILFAIISRNQPMPPRGAAKPLQVSFELSQKQAQTAAVLT